MYKFASIVLVPFPFTDLSSSKLRPAMIISDNNNENEDVILAFISTKISNDKHSIQLKSDSKEFLLTGLKKTSEIRLDKIATLRKSIILGELGFVSKEFIAKNRDRFYKIFGF